MWNASGPCAGGYYCPEGQSSALPAEFICTPGHYCPEGSIIMQTCSPGFYQDEFGKVCFVQLVFKSALDVVANYLSKNILFL
jgi:hypothetical protein